VSGFAEALSTRAHVLTPIYPGFAGEPRPEWFNSIDDLALTYLELLERLVLRDVMVVGFSIGGWIASELAVRDTTRLGSIVLVDAVGIQVDGHDIADVFPLTPDELSALSYHNPVAFRIDPTTLSTDQVAARAANFQALKLYDQGKGMCDPKLRRRLTRVRIPALVVWGESDGVVDADYGRAYAQSLPNARFKLIPEAGHVPQIEQPERLLTLVWEFADSMTATQPIAGSFE
jgi:pimeloyl-ACP methyl ester carboxylesterase